MYKKKRYVRFLYRATSLLLIFVLSSLFSYPSYAQQSRRGLFLQDSPSRNTTVDSFREQDLGDLEDEDELGQQDLLQGRSRRSRGFRGSSAGLSYQVHVLGEVKRPGTYRVAPSMRVTDALLLAGGIKRSGSERFVDLRKQGQSRGKALDLFAYKTLGNLSQNPYLQNNNTIFVPLKTKAVEIEGPVRRPGVYELRNEKTLFDIIKLAGGFTVGAHRESPVKVIRYHGHKDKEIIEVSDQPGELRQFMLRDGDVIVVQHQFLTKHQFDYNLRKLPNDNIFYPAYEDKVFVIGGVKAPGAFEFNQYYTLRQYMTLAGGTTTMAKRKKIKVVRVDGTVIKAKNGEYDGVINPGDTIVVPEKSIPNQFYIGLMTTIASIGVSAIAIFR